MKDCIDDLKDLFQFQNGPKINCSYCGKMFMIIPDSALLEDRDNIQASHNALEVA